MSDSPVSDFVDVMSKALDVAEGLEHVVIEGKVVRRVRTHEGSRRFGVPVGSIIDGNGHFVQQPKPGRAVSPDKVVEDSAATRRAADAQNPIVNASERARGLGKAGSKKRSGRPVPSPIGAGGKKVGGRKKTTGRPVVSREPGSVSERLKNHLVTMDQYDTIRSLSEEDQHRYLDHRNEGHSHDRAIRAVRNSPSTVRRGSKKRTGGAARSPLTNRKG
jgi:hypothetical protein